MGTTASVRCFVAVLVAAAVAGTSRAEGPFLEDELEREVWTHLAQASERTRDQIALATRIAALGPPVIPLVYEIWVGRRSSPPDSRMPAREDIRQVCERALEKSSETQVHEYLRTRVRESREPRERLFVVELLGKLGRASAASIVLELLRESDALLSGSAIEKGTFRRSLATSLQRDARTFQTIDQAWGTIQDDRIDVVIDSVGELRTDLADRLFVSKLGSSDLRDRLLLSTLLRRADRLSSVVRDRLAEYLIEAMDGSSVLLKKAAAHAAGELHDLHLMEALVRRLADENAGVGDVAHRSIQQMAGCPVPRDAGACSAWWQNEKAWWNDRGTDLLQTLQSRDSRDVFAAIAELSRKKLFRDAILGELIAIQEGAAPALRRAICSAMPQLGSPLAIPHLRRAIEDEDPQVRAVAWKGLRVLTGKKLPLDPAAWDAAGFTGNPFAR